MLLSFKHSPLALNPQIPKLNSPFYAEGARPLAEVPHPEPFEGKSIVLITGGAGFIGSNIAWRHLDRGDAVIVWDNLSRPGVELNLAWLRTHNDADRLFQFEEIDIRRRIVVMTRMATLASRGPIERIYHCASQVAVTTSIQRPFEDFEVNCAGTVNLLEAARQSMPRAKILYTSTNKVYGDLPDVAVEEGEQRFDYSGGREGINEDYPLQFISPYGCSKGAGDQYVLDYARIYGMKTAVLRMSCQYGPRQFGTEDQGWVAHFCRRALDGGEITICGTGKQVRDLLFVDDLLDVMDRALAEPRGAVYNIGGGREFSMSLVEVIAILEESLGRKIPLRFVEDRPGDQRVYITNIAKARRELDWQPKVSPLEGIPRLLDWMKKNPGAPALKG